MKWNTYVRMYVRMYVCSVNQVYKYIFIGFPYHS